VRARADRREDRVVEACITQFRFFREEGVPLTEHRRGRMQQPPDNPVVELGHRIRAVHAHVQVRRSAADEGVHLER
jgi:hypothetical protein